MQDINTHNVQIETTPLSESAPAKMPAEFYSHISQILKQARGRAYSAVNYSMVLAYWEIGHSIVEEQGGEERAAYGDRLIAELSKQLTADFGKGFDESNLLNMRRFYLMFPIQDSLRPELTWTHYRKLIKVKDSDARTWYMNEAANEHWSTRQLDRQISVLYYERLLASNDKAPVIAEANEKLAGITPEQFIKDPYVLEFLDLKDYPSLRETDLEQALINHLQEFLLELCSGFCFVARQKRMRFDDEDFYLDLVFYHAVLKCYVIIDLKMGKLTHADVGQMDSYIRMFDALQKRDDDNPTIGLILCSEKNEAIAKYSALADGKQMFASRYVLELPTTEELEQQIQETRREFELTYEKNETSIKYVDEE
jgi:predicted nuclease of restriction endonuclease-like (RecB) superfamily